jgi:hypothetical protein
VVRAAESPRLADTPEPSRSLLLAAAPASQRLPQLLICSHEAVGATILVKLGADQPLWRKENKAVLPASRHDHRNGNKALIPSTPRPVRTKRANHNKQPFQMHRAHNCMDGADCDVFR